MEYSIKKDTWYIINDQEPQAGKIPAGGKLYTTRPVNFYENKSKWKIDVDKISNIIIDK